jgi:hypothetical protein
MPGTSLATGDQRNEADNKNSMDLPSCNLLTWIFTKHVKMNYVVLVQE